MTDGFYTVERNGPPTALTAPHGYRYQTSDSERWWYVGRSPTGRRATLVMPATKWQPLPAPPTTEAAPPVLERWGVVGSCPSGSGGWLTYDGRTLTPRDADHLAAIANALDRDGVAWGSGRAVSELPESGRVLVRLRTGAFVVWEVGELHKLGDIARWWPLPNDWEG